MFSSFSVEASPRTGYRPPACPVITAGLGRPLRQKQEAVHGAGSRPLSFSPMSQAGPTPAKHRKVPVPSTRCGRIFRRKEGREDSSLLSPDAHVYALCVCVCVCQRGAHLLSGIRVTLLHTGSTDSHLNATAAASNTRLHPQEETTV